MAELQMKLKQYEKAERTVSQALDAENNGSQRSNDMNSLMTQVDFRNIQQLMTIDPQKIVIKICLLKQARFYTLLAKIQERAGSLDQAMRTLSDAKDIRARLLKRVQVEQPDAVEEQVIQNMPV